MAWARNLAWLIVAAMAALFGNILLNGSLDQGLGMDRFLAGLADPWQTFIGFDLLSGLLLMAGWIAWREGAGRWLDAAAWILCLNWWGNIIVAGYILVAWQQSARDPARFFMGTRAGPLRQVWNGHPAARLLALAVAIGLAGFMAQKIARLGLSGLPGQAYLAGFLPIILALVLLALPARRSAQG